MNYSNSQRAGVILYLAASLFGGYVCISTYLDRIVEDLDDIDMLIEEDKGREANRVGKVKESLITILSTSTDQELQEMLEDNSTSEIAKECIKEEIKFRKGGPNNE